ncbi:MAG: hypothetical protein ABIH24_09280 [Verrucomicrobiota bacterium]
MTMHRFRRPVSFLILAAFILAFCPGHISAESSGNQFVDDKTDIGNILNGMGVLNVGGDTASGAGKILTIFDICDAVEKAYNGEYNDAMAIMLKTGMTTFVAAAGLLTTSLDVGQLLRNVTVNKVFEPRIAAHYQKYRDLRIADLEADLAEKMVKYTTKDFIRWAEDVSGETVKDTGQDTVNRFINEEFMADGQRSSYLYNVAQMRIQDDKHSKQSFAVKWWPRFWTSEKPVAFEDAKDYWLNTWNEKVAIEGLQIAVDRRRHFAAEWIKMSNIRIVVDVAKPIEGLKYGIECVELDWREKAAVSRGFDGNYVLFGKSIDMAKFSELRQRYGINGGLTIQLKAPGQDGRTVAAKRIPFTDIMSLQHLQKKKNEVAMWSEFRVPVKFDWRPDLLKQLNMIFNGNARVDSIKFRLGNRNVTLRRKPDSGCLNKGELPLEKHLKEGKLDIVSVLEASGLKTDDALACLYGSQDNLWLNCSFRMTDPECDPKKDPPNKMASFGWQRDLAFPESDLQLDFNFTPQKKPRIDDSEARNARARELAMAYIAAPGTQPKDEFVYQQKLPLNSSPGDAYLEARNRRIEQELTEPVARLAKAVDELNVGLSEIRSKYVYSCREEIPNVFHDCLSLEIPIPAYKEILAKGMDDLTGKIGEGRQKLTAQMKEAEDLLSKDAKRLKATVKQLVNLNPSPLQLTVAVGKLTDLLRLQEEALRQLDEYECLAKGKAAEYDILLEKLTTPAAVAAFYLPEIERLQKRRLALHEKTETLMDEDVRQPEYVLSLNSRLQEFNDWATGNSRSANCLSLDMLYDFLMNKQSGQPWGRDARPIDEMISGIEMAIAKVVKPEILLLEETADVREKLAKYKLALISRSGVSPLMALYAHDITASDIKACLAKPPGRISDALQPAHKRSWALQQQWNESEKLPAPANRRRHPELTFWVLSAGGAIDSFLTVTKPEVMTKGDGKAAAWLAEHNALRTKLGNVGANSYLQDTLAGIKLLEQHYKALSGITGSSWPDRYKAEWAANYERPTIGEVFNESMVKAWMGAMDILDKKMQRDIKALPSLPPERQKAEKERLTKVAQNSFWNALGLAPLSQTKFGRGIYIGCYEGRQITEVYVPAHQKWGELQVAWHDALNAVSQSGANGETPGTKTRKEIDQEAPGTASDQAAYQKYIAAYNKMTRLMAAGKGNTPEAQAAHREYIKQKDAYEASLKK